MAAGRRLVIISYRIPFHLKKDGETTRLVQNSGGLVSAIISVLQRMKESNEDSFSKVIWVGISDDAKKDLNPEQGLFELEPVKLEEEVHKKFYEGFSNDLLWPLLHYFTTFAVFDDSYYEQYEKANREVFEAVARLIRPGDVIWVHDYHFLLLPHMIRERFKDVSIGFFLHIPFPSFEIFRLLPHRWREPIVQGLLGADLIGFHTLDYAYHFLTTVRKLFDIEHVNRILFYENRQIKVEAFPISIDYRKFREATLEPAVKEEIEKLKSFLGSFKLIFSIDRLDYTKGIINRLQGYEYFLQTHPEWHGKVRYQMVVIPSRDTIPQYREMHNQIDGMVGRINSQYSAINWNPILYQYKSLRFEELVALYDLSNVGLITPIRDGMNLVSKEYVVSQRQTEGVLILSEMAGAAAELRDALIINPIDRKEISDAIVQALTMPAEERKERMERMRKRLKEYDVFEWTTDFIDQLDEVKQMNETESSHEVTSSVIRTIVNDYRRAERRIMMLDYDGTLVPLQLDPDRAIPHDELLQMLSKFGSDPRNIVVLISGRDKAFLERWFGSLPVILVAEHGAFTRMPDNQWIRITGENPGWKSSITNLLRVIALKYPGTRIEEKEQSVALHYRNVPDLGQVDLEYIKTEILPVVMQNDLQILEGNKVLEIKNSSFNKGTSVQQFLSYVKEDFMLAIGDDKTDEDLFRAIPTQAYTIKVGTPSQHARYYIQRPEDVVELLGRLLEKQS